MTSTNVADLEGSVFASKIGTNYGATDDEVEQLKELLSAPTAELDKLQKEIERVSSQLDGLYSNHRALFRKVDAHRALMSPIRRMPVDIIREIFLRCLPTQHKPIMSRHHAPVILTQVCSSWRHIAHSTPLLWNAIYIVVPCQISNPHFFPASGPRGTPISRASSAQEVAHRRAAGIEQWLNRSGECPLDIVIYERDRYASEAAYDVILTAVIPFSRRWQTIQFQSPSTCLSRVTALSADDVPMLRSLTIRGQDMPSNNSLLIPGVNQDAEVPDFQFLVGSGLLKAPQLRQIVYTRVTEDLSRFPLKWEQLTVISLFGCAWTVPDYLSLSKITQILQRCPALVKCMFEITLLPPGPTPGGFQAPATKIVKPIRLLSLESMSLQSSRTDLTALFRALEVPALRKLEFFINPAHMDDGTFAQEVMAFLQRTSSTLRALTMDPFFLSKESLHTCLRHCPELRALSLKFSHFPGHELWTPPPQHSGLPDDPAAYTVSDDLLTAFIDDMDPLLERLELFECNVDAALSDDALVSFIQAKQSGGGSYAPLKKVAVTLRRPQTLSMASALRRYVQSGLDCQLIYSPSYGHATFPASDGIFNDFSNPPWGLLSFDDDGDADTN